MNDDDNTGEQTAPGSPRKRTVAVAAAVGVAGLVAGGVAAATLSSAAAVSGADTGASTGRGGYGVPRDGYGARPPAGQAEGEGQAGGKGGDYPEDAGPAQGGARGEGAHPAPPREQGSAPSTEDSSYRES